MKSYPLGAKAAIEIGLLDANNKPVKADRDYIIEIELHASPLHKLKKKMQDTIRVGEASAKFQLPLEEIGILEIHANHRQLLSGDTIIHVRKPVIRSLQKPRQGAWLPGVDLRFVGASMMASYAPPQFVSDQGTFLLLKRSPHRTLLADGKDTATIHVFYASEEGTAPSDIRVRLFTSGGTLKPEPSQPLVIRKDEDYASATLTSDKIETVTVEYLGSTPTVPPPPERQLQINFGPPITQLDLSASPPEITLADHADLIVRLLDEQGRPIETDAPRLISFAIDTGRGEIKDDTLQIPKGHSDGRTSFAPTWRGQVKLTAATPNLQIADTSLTVTLPILLLILSAIGGVAGGGIAYWMHPGSKWWRIVIGLVTGFVLYWAFIFGVLTVLPRSVVLNPLSAFALSTLGGWLGTEVFTFILKRFGIAN